jgi:pyruvate dehydrogenase E1 component alpha subunit
MTADDLIAFEREVAEAFERKEILGPIHLSGGNEEELISIFSCVRHEDWVFSTYRSHYHALLKGVPRERVMDEIKAGRSMNLHFPEHRFHTSAIVGGCLPIAVGVAAGIKRRGSNERVWCFVGDMAASIGAFSDATRYACGQRLPIRFVVEDNALSCDSPTAECWGEDRTPDVEIYHYDRKHPHVGTGTWIAF